MTGIIIDQGDRDDMATITWLPPDNPAALSIYVLTIQTISGTAVQTFTVQDSSSLKKTVGGLRKFSTIALTDKKQWYCSM